MIIYIILVYIFSIFLNRWLNKIYYKKHKRNIVVILWFLGGIGTIVLLIALILDSNFADWFTGKNW